MKTLTLGQVFRQIAYNVQEGKSPVDRLRVGNGSTWGPMSQGYTISALVMTELRFALAPRTHNINGYDVPAPETEAPDVGAEYFALNAQCGDGVHFSTWDGCSSYDKNTLRHGLWLSREDAMANAKALRGEDPYKEAE